MANSEETKEEQGIVIEKAYQGDRPGPTADEVTDAGAETGIKFSYKDERPGPKPVFEKPNNENTNDES